MPRTARKKSITNTYHVVIKGLDQQIMFEESKDYTKYLALLELYSVECHFNIFAYCLMSNHVHIILQTTDYPLETIFRKLNTHYAIWFNMKYQRTGHLQQERYYSEPIEDNTYLLSAIRYVHQNPLHAGCENNLGESYPWSSFYEYSKNIPRLVNIDYIFKIISRDDFLRFNTTENLEKHIDIGRFSKRIPDDVAKNIIFTVTSCSTTTEFQALSLLARNNYVRELHKKGLSIRQINRLTGIPRGIIERALSCKEQHSVFSS